MIKRAVSSAIVAPRSEAEGFFAANPNVDSVEMIYTDFGGVPRGKRLRQHEVLSVYEIGRFFPGSITIVDITGQDTVETGLVWEDGDADRSMKPIPAHWSKPHGQATMPRSSWSISTNSTANRPPLTRATCWDW